MIVIIGNDIQKTELSQSLTENITWIHEPESIEAEACVDLVFEYSEERIEKLQKISPVVFVNDVVGNHPALPPQFIGFNGWPGFFEKPILEATIADDSYKTGAVAALLQLNKKISWTSNTAGFVSARTIAMIVNEAYMTLEEGVATKEDIDTAMKLGTNYPFGPFEWSEKIGLQNIYHLLLQLSQQHNKYEPCSLLTNEALIK